MWDVGHNRGSSQRWMPMDDNKTAINTNICLLWFWMGQVCLDGPIYMMLSWKILKLLSSKKKKQTSSSSPWCRAPQTGCQRVQFLTANGVQVGARMRLAWVPLKMSGFDLHNSHHSQIKHSQKWKDCTVSGNNDLDCNETGSVCISEEFHVLLAIKAACKVALKVN